MENHINPMQFNDCQISINSSVLPVQQFDLSCSVSPLIMFPPCEWRRVHDTACPHLGCACHDASLPLNSDIQHASPGPSSPLRSAVLHYITSDPCRREPLKSAILHRSCQRGGPDLLVTSPPAHETFKSASDKRFCISAQLLIYSTEWHSTITFTQTAVC